MALHLLPILKALGPIVANAGAAAAAFAGVRGSSETRKTDERLAQLAALNGELAKQTQAIAEQLRAHMEVNDMLRKENKRCWILSMVALALGAGALIVAWFR